MSHEKTKPTPKAWKVVCAALCAVLAAAPLAACGGGASSGGDDASAGAGQAAAIDTSSWKTLGDALAVKTESMSSGWDDNYYVAVFGAGDSVLRVVAQVDAAGKEAMDNVDWEKGDVGEQVEEAAKDLALVSVEDLTGEMLSQQEMDALVGKTGQELVDEGWQFQDYFMYGGDQTAATFVRGYLAYSFTFDVTVTDADTEDGGASVMGAPIAEVEFTGASNDATDPTLV